MIRLNKPKKNKKEFEEWFENNREDLLERFNRYFHESSGDWIAQKYREDIQEMLFKTSYEKCAYCERKPNEGGGNLEIEHFYPKKMRKSMHLAFDYDNLLPSCKQCNTVKGMKYKDREGNEIINPYVEEDISIHLSLNPENMLIKGISCKGRATVAVLAKSLNTNRLLQDGKILKGALFKRLTIQEDLNKRLHISRKHKKHLDVLFDGLKELLELIDKKNACAATYSSVILAHPVFEELLEYIREKDPLKCERLDNLISSAQEFCLSL